MAEEKKLNLTKPQIIELADVILLAILGLIADILSIATKVAMGYLPHYAHIVVYVFIVLYAVFGYKKPHGNMLRNMFLLSICSEVFILWSTDFVTKGMSICIVVITALSAFMAGRLHKYNQNKVIMAVVGALYLVYAFMLIFAFKKYELEINFARGVSAFSGFIIWSCLMAAYVLRFQLHKEAGLAEKEK